MANPLPFLIMSPLQSARFREETAADENRLEPRLVEAGPYKGQYAIPRRVIDDPAFAARQDALLMLPEAVIDTDVAFPQPEV